MGYYILFTFGILFLYFGLRVATAFLSVFGEHIILFDSILLAVLAWALSKGYIHSAFALLVGIFTFLLLFALQKTTIGFYLIGLIMSLAWGAFFGVVALIFTSDSIWTLVSFGLATVVVIALHFSARHKTLEESLGEGLDDF